MEIREAFDHFSESLDCPEIPHARCGFGQTQGLGDLLIIELFIMPHEDDLTVPFFELAYSQLHVVGEFFLSRGGRWGQSVVFELVCQFDCGIFV